MAYNFPSGFNITGSEPIDKRLIMTKKEMLAAKNASMPEMYICLCSDDGLLYIYNKSNKANLITGKFRAYAADAVTDDLKEELKTEWGQLGSTN